MSKKLYTFKCWHDDYGDEYAPSYYIAETASKAKKQHHDFLRCELGWCGSFIEIVRDMRCVKKGESGDSSMFGDATQFDRIKHQRGIDFAEMGMTVITCGKKGKIVGANESCNLDVLFEGETWVSNVHPLGDVIYYNNEGDVIKDFRKNVNNG